MRIRKCRTDGTYTMKEACPKCQGPTVQVGPARYSPQDTYGKYRRMMKEQMRDG